MEKKMKIISSQHFLETNIVNAKEVALKLSNATAVKIPCSFVGKIGGEEYAIVIDGHHTMAAAKRLGLEINFETNADSEGLEGERLLEARYLDGDYYHVESSDAENYEFDLVW